MVVLGLRCCAWAFSSCGERGLLFAAVHGGFSCCGAWALGARTSVVVAQRALERRLSSCGVQA